MKRLLLGSLLSCMLVGQSLCDVQENCINMCKGALNAIAKSGATAISAGTLGLVFTGEEKNCFKMAGVFATIVAIWNTSYGIYLVENATELNPSKSATLGWYGGGQVLGGLTSCALVAYLSKKISN